MPSKKRAIIGGPKGNTGYCPANPINGGLNAGKGFQKIVKELAKINSWANKALNPHRNKANLQGKLIIAPP